MVWFLIGILAALIILIGILFYLSPGKVNPLLDENGNAIPDSISEKTMVEINGMQQGIILHGVPFWECM